MIRILLALAALVLGSSAIAAPDTIYVMRHLERDAGRDPDLNAMGRANAEILGRWFRHERPRAIWVTSFKRTHQTAAPLAKRLKLTPTVYDATAPAAMLTAVAQAKGPVLIVGHSNTVPRIVEALGGPKAAGDLPDDDHGRIWIGRRGVWSVAELAKPQPTPVRKAP